MRSAYIYRLYEGLRAEQAEEASARFAAGAENARRVLGWARDAEALRSYLRQRRARD